MKKIVFPLCIAAVGCVFVAAVGCSSVQNPCSRGSWWTSPWQQNGQPVMYGQSPQMYMDPCNPCDANCGPTGTATTSYPGDYMPGPITTSPM